METCYKKIYLPEHHRADITGFVGMHILEAERQLGRPLKKHEIVHHKDFCKLNNASDNLQIMTRLYHQQLPERQAQFLIEHDLLETFFDWWDKYKDGHDRLRELEYKIAIQENKAAYQRSRIRLKLENAK